MVEEIIGENKDVDNGLNYTKEQDDNTPKIRWCIFNKVNHLKFLDKDVIALGHDVYITFMNLKTSTSKIYQANSKENGDGVDCIAGFRSSIFAFAEKTEHPRIFICEYPKFNRLAVLKDTEVSTYKQIVMTEGDLLVGFSRLPNYTISVWSWRTCQKYLSIPTSIIRSNQYFLPSRTRSAVAQTWGSGLIVWEMSPCNKVCMLMKKTLSNPPLEIYKISWAADGNLYAIDEKGNLYGIINDIVGLVSRLEWSPETTGTYPVNFCQYCNGLLLICPDGLFRYLKKIEKEWQVYWSHSPDTTFLKLVAYDTGDKAFAITHSGIYYQINNNHQEEPVLSVLTYKQRNIKQLVTIYPSGLEIATLNADGELCIYDVATGNLCAIYQLNGKDLLMNSSRIQPMVVVSGELGENYGLTLLTVSTGRNNTECKMMCSLNLTNQIIEQVFFSDSKMELVAAALSAGHIFIIEIISAPEMKLSVTKYIQVGRGLADILYININRKSKLIGLVRFSENYKTGEKLVCYDVDSTEESKVVGRMLGPYKELRSTEHKGKVLAIPHLSRQVHVLQFASDRSAILQIKVEKVFNSQHELASYSGYMFPSGLITFGIDGFVHFKKNSLQDKSDVRIVASHRYYNGIQYAAVNPLCNYIVSLTQNQTVAVHYIGNVQLNDYVEIKPIQELLYKNRDVLDIFDQESENWLQVQERKSIELEAAACYKNKQTVTQMFDSLQDKLRSLLEENLAAPIKHQVPLNEFNLHLEAKQLRIKQAAEERETIRLNLEAKIIAQSKVTDWIKKTCWESMKVPRVRLFEIFSHYIVENYCVLPTQTEIWPELKQIQAWRSIEMENNNALQPWLQKSSEISILAQPSSVIEKSQVELYATSSVEQKDLATFLQNQYVLSGTLTHNYIDIPIYDIPQMAAYSYLQLQWAYQLAKFKTQKMRLWFNRHFDEIMSLKCREVGLVEERNRRLRTIISELNTLSALRGSVEIINIAICDPEWSQEEMPHKLTTVEPEEVSVTPYISPSQIFIPPPEPQPKDDFRERALMDMMDGVLEKLWHEEIKKPIPEPTCMIEKQPENWNEDDLRDVFEYEAKVKTRNEEREKYRKMLHSEYEKIVTLLNEGVVRFNNKVKNLFVTKLQVQTAMQQEILAVTRMKRVNLDRMEDGETIVRMRNTADIHEKDIEKLHMELKMIQEQVTDCQTTFDTLSTKDKMLDRNFRSNFPDDSPVVVDQCYRMFKKRPKWHQRASMIPAVLAEMAQVCASGVTSPFLHPDCVEYLRALDQMDAITNMPPIMDEVLWTSMCKLRRAKIENEIKVRAVSLESANVDSAWSVWSRALALKKVALAAAKSDINQLREDMEAVTRNKTIQLTLKGGFVEMPTTGHIQDFDDALLLRREDVESVNNMIQKVGQRKVNAMLRHMQFQRQILTKEWEHAQLKMKIRHMEQELYAIQRMKVTKELQAYLRGITKGWTEEQDYTKMEREVEATKSAFNKLLYDHIHKVENIESKLNNVLASTRAINDKMFKLRIQLSDKRHKSNPLDAIRQLQLRQKRMKILVEKSRLVRKVQDNYTNIVLLQTELELLRLKTYPTLATFHTLD